MAAQIRPQSGIDTDRKDKNQTVLEGLVVGIEARQHISFSALHNGLTNKAQHAAREGFTAESSVAIRRFFSCFLFCFFKKKINDAVFPRIITYDRNENKRCKTAYITCWEIVD